MYSDAIISLFSKLNTSSVSFMLLLLLVIYVLFQVQKRPDFDFAEMLKTNGKPSAARLGMLVSLAVSSWIIIDVASVDLSTANSSSRLFELLGLYLGVFAGAKVLEKGISTWGRSQNTFSGERRDFRETAQPDFADTVPIRMEDVLERR